MSSARLSSRSGDLSFGGETRSSKSTGARIHKKEGNDSIYMVSNSTFNIYEKDKPASTSKFFGDFPYAAFYQFSMTFWPAKMFDDGDVRMSKNAVQYVAGALLI